MISRKRSAQDFIFKEELGHGSYSRVYKAIEKSSGQLFAIKVCSKKHIISEKKVKYVMIEKNTLNLLASGKQMGIVTLYYTFHDTENLYYVLDYAPGGELLQLLQEHGRFSEGWSRHFMCQLVDVLEYVHGCKVIHRDLKPENVLLSREGRVMLTDFGAASNLNEVQDGSRTTSSFVGTAEYVSPELLLDNRCSYSSDVWALGCMLFQFTQGSPPFRGGNELETFEKIVKLDYRWEYPVTRLVKDLCSRILVLDPSSRYDLAKISRHQWFEGVDWTNKEQLWKGIFQISRGTNGGSYTNASVLNKQLHVIDTQIKNIPIRPKKRKPAKVTQTTSSIVQWRKTLGITSASSSSSSSSNSSPAVPNKTRAQNSTTAPQIQWNHPRSAANTLYSKGSMNGGSRNGTSKAVRPVESKPLIEPLDITLIPQYSTAKTPVSPLSPVVGSLSPPSTKDTQKTLVNTSPRKITANSEASSANVIKQGWITLLEIPFVQSAQKTFTTNEYSFIDDQTITRFLAKNSRNMSKKSGLRLMSLDSMGNLYHRSANLQEYSPIVSIIDYDLSIYDSDFDESKSKGFLILEKFKTKIWFISLPVNPPIKSVINPNETWIQCLFNTRKRLESQKLSNKLETLNISNTSKSSQDASSYPNKHTKSPVREKMFVSSSRFEVLSTLSRQKRGSTDAASGASAAFKNMAR